MTELFKPLTGSPLIASVAAATPAGAVATASASIGSLPPALADITAGTVIAGIVVDRTRGQITLKTDKGLMQLQTSLPLKLGASVVLEVQSVGAQVRLAILSVDQRAPTVSARDAPEMGAGTLPAPTESEESSASTQSSRAASPLVGRTLTATVVGPPDSRIAGSKTDPTIPTLLRRLVAMSAVVRVAAETTTAIADEAMAASASTVPPQARTDRPPPGPVAPGAVRVDGENGEKGLEPLVIPTAEELEAALKTLPAPARDIVAALLDDRTLETPTAAKPAPTANASEPQAPSPDRAPSPAREATGRDATTVAAKTLAIRILAQSQSLGDATPLRPQVATRSDAILLVGTAVDDGAGGTEVETPLGRLRLPLPTPLPPGTRVMFEVLSRGADALAATQPDGAPEALARLVDAERDWSAARDIVAQWPEAADALLPKAGQPLGPALLAFLAAVRGGGNLKAWLGSRFAEAAEAVPEKKELMTRLGQEMATQGRTVASTEHGTWQTIAVPVIDAGRVSELRFRFRKRDRRDDSEEKEDRRFVVQAKLSALGPLQIDGIVRARHLDLIVRTAKALPAPMRRDIADVFARSLADTDFRGEIRFRDDGLDVTPGTAGHGSGVVV